MLPRPHKPRPRCGHVTSVRSCSPRKSCRSTCRDAEERRRKQDEARADMMAANERQKQLKVCLCAGLPLPHGRHLCQPRGPGPCQPDDLFARCLHVCSWTAVHSSLVRLAGMLQGGHYLVQARPADFQHLPSCAAMGCQPLQVRVGPDLHRERSLHLTIMSSMHSLSSQLRQLHCRCTP